MDSSVFGKGKLWAKGDLTATVGVFVDGFAKVITAAATMQFTLKLPIETIYGKILPGVGITVLILNVMFGIYSRRLNAKEGRTDYVALPTGLHATRVFTWLFAIMLPVYFATGDGVAAWNVGVMCNLISSIIFIITGFFSDIIQKNIPPAALFGTLAGGALGVLGVNIVAKMFNQPLIGFVATFALLILYLGKKERKIPAPVIAIILGTIVSWVIGVNNMDTLRNGISSTSFSLPTGYFAFLSVPFVELLPYLGIVLVFTVHGAINSIMGIKQAHEVGDNIDVKKSMLLIGVVNILSCFVGNPFPLGVFWGHNTWKELKVGTSYSFAVGITYAVLCFSGLIAVLNGIIPEQATYPILLFIALSTIGQSIRKVEVKYHSVLGLTFIISLLELFYDKTETAMKAALSLANVKAGSILTGTNEVFAALTANKMDAIGYLTMGKGAMFTSLIWGSLFVFAIDQKWKKAAFASLVGAVFTFFGMIHSLTPGLMCNLPIVGLYCALSVILCLFKSNKESLENV